MQLLTLLWFVIGGALLLLITGPATSRATPLTKDADAKDMVELRITRQLSDTEIVGSGPARPESGINPPSPAESAVQQYVRVSPQFTGTPGSQDLAGSQRSGATVSSPVEIFRGLVNVPQGGAKNGAPRPGTAADTDLLGSEAREWIDDAVRGIVSSAFDLRINEQGRTSFSVLGMADFSVMLSSDRNELALVNGDDGLLAAHRSPLAQADLAAGRTGFDTAATSPLSNGTGATTADHPLRQALELVQEMATHPLSMLLYAVVGGLILLWNILSFSARRAARPASESRSHPARSVATKGSGRRRSRRSRRT